MISLSCGDITTAAHYQILRLTKYEKLKTGLIKSQIALDTSTPSELFLHMYKIHTGFFEVWLARSIFLEAFFFYSLAYRKPVTVVTGERTV